MKKLENQVRNEIFRQMSLTSTLALDVPVRPMDAKGLITPYGYAGEIPYVPQYDIETPCLQGLRFHMYKMTEIISTNKNLQSKIHK